MKLVPAVQERLFDRLVIGFVAAGFTILTVLGAFGLAVLERNLDYTARVAHTYEVQNALADFRIANERSETARRGYLLSRDEAFLRTYRTAQAALTPALRRIDQLTADNPRQVARVERLRALMDQQREAAERSIQDARAGAALTSGAFALDAGVLRMRDIRALALVMANEERQLLEARNKLRVTSMRNLIIVVLVAGVLLLLVGLGSIWVILRYTHDLTDSRDALSRLNAGLEDSVRARTADLQRANDEIQRFAYIVSHDLRAPLVNIMGFTSELEAATPPLKALLDRARAEAPTIVTPEASVAVESDLPEAMGFIRTSTQKMDRLINAILKLSREGRRVLTPEPLDMRPLLEGVAANLKHRTEELGAAIEVSDDLPEVVSDRLALEQIFSNLLENAVKYLKPGRPGRVEIRGRLQDDRAIFEVADNGRGIDPKDHDRIFDLFRRSGMQDQPGEGIGLAHVRALTYRLGGVIDCESALDQGATFRVSLPAQLTVEGQGS